MYFQIHTLHQWVRDLCGLVPLGNNFLLITIYVNVILVTWINKHVDTQIIEWNIAWWNRFLKTFIIFIKFLDGIKL